MLCSQSDPPGSVGTIDASLPIVFLSSSQSSDAFVDLLSELDIRGVDFRLVPKVEVDSGPAVAAIRRFGDSALYVICRDEALDAACAERLQAACLLSGLTLGHSVLTLNPGSLSTYATIEMLLELVEELARELPQERPGPPPASVEPLTIAAPEANSSPFEIADGPLRPPALPPLSRRSWSFIGATMLLLVGFGLARLAGDGTNANSAASVRASRIDAGASPPSPVVAGPTSETTFGTPDARPLELEERYIARALAGHELRALDMLLVDPERSGKVSLEAARGYCQARSHQGLPGWRLPEVAEASAVLQAQLANSDRYWTETSADAASTRHVVYDATRRRMRATNPTSRSARAICVRDRHISKSP